MRKSGNPLLVDFFEGNLPGVISDVAGIVVGAINTATTPMPSGGGGSSNAPKKKDDEDWWGSPTGLVSRPIRAGSQGLAVFIDKRKAFLPAFYARERVVQDEESFIVRYLFLVLYDVFYGLLAVKLLSELAESLLHHCSSVSEKSDGVFEESVHVILLSAIIVATEQSGIWPFFPVAFADEFCQDVGFFLVFLLGMGFFCFQFLGCSTIQHPLR